MQDASIVRIIVVTAAQLLRLLHFDVLQANDVREDTYFQMTVAAGGNDPHMVRV